MRLVFCGTPEFAVPVLRAVKAAGHDVQLVLTQPDRASGRGLELSAPAVKREALAMGLEVLQPERIKNNVELQERLTAIAPDAILVVAYGRILPKWMVELPRLGNINLHASLLPKYRGAAPVQWAIARGESVTGNTTMRIDEGLDTGDILLQREMAIGTDDTAPQMFAKLAEDGAALMVETLRGLEAGTIAAKKQDDSQATLAMILTRENGRMDFAMDARTIYNRWRGFHPWPGAHTMFRGKRMTVHAMAVAEDVSVEPGVLAVSGGDLHVGCAGGTALRLLEVQMEGRKRMSAMDFVRGCADAVGDRLGE